MRSAISRKSRMPPAIPIPRAKRACTRARGKSVAAADCVTSAGQTHLSIENMPPIIMRGVLVDVAAYREVDMLPPAYSIGAGDIRGALEKQGTAIGRGYGRFGTNGHLPLITRWQSPVSRCASRTKSGSSAVSGRARHDIGGRGQYGGGGYAADGSLGGTGFSWCIAASPMWRT